MSVVGEPGDGVTSSANASMKRLACEPCRDRKIRCDRQHPTCGRCARMRNTCSYSTRSKSTLSNADLSRFLLAMSQRLQQIEARVALNSNGHGNGAVVQETLPTPPRERQVENAAAPTRPLSSSLQPMTLSAQPNPPILASRLDMFGMGGEEMQFEYSASEVGWLDLAGNDGHGAADFNVDPLPPIQLDPKTSPPVAECQLPSQFDPMSLETFSSTSNQTQPELSSGLLHGLYDRYFDLFHPILPMISRTRFEADLESAETPQVSSLGIHALSWAMATLGSSSIPELRGHVDRCYEQCRVLLELAERQDTGESLDLNSLQALILLTLYESKQPKFARSWMTLGRAIRLAKMMGLDQGASCLSAIRTPTHVGPSLPPPASPSEAEERRRTYWALFVLDTISTMKTNAKTALERPNKMPLPSLPGYPDDPTQPGICMPTLHQVFAPETGDNVSLSPFAGVIVVMWLYRRYVEHTTSQQTQDAHELVPSRSFWETHYSIEKDIARCKNKTLVRYIEGEMSDDPRSLILRINLAAVEISLHQTAVAKVEESKLPTALAIDAITKCASAATDIARAAQIGKSLWAKNRETFRQQDRFVVWPMTLAIHVLGRLVEKKDDVGGGTEGLSFSLRVLGRAMRDLIRPEHVQPGLMDKVDGWLGAKSCSPEQEVEDDNSEGAKVG
ncbi:fungal-specific transcription factor domain-containing protein [Corynascus novoguineensis]|uniref:Fungal-specific transcription factor domain-containing protein n=1 Tax=Corynascus novoguineensis TaxID=1126955 RepID=A0AAN7HKG0_9PEZI|nr:fungal-specific transcription factor domain-containing protein [Corynascus novoguineensis]